MNNCKKLIGVAASLSLFATTTPVFAVSMLDIGDATQVSKTTQVNHTDYTISVNNNTTTQSLKYGWNVLNNDPNSIKFQKADKTLAVGWSNADGNWRYFDSNNNMVRSKWIQDGSAWYYLKADGVMAKNMNVDGYHVNASGAWDSDAVSGAITYSGVVVQTASGTSTGISASDFESKVASALLKAKVVYYTNTGGSTSGQNMGTLSFYFTK